jgi:hypothetical protein
LQVHKVGLLAAASFEYLKALYQQLVEPLLVYRKVVLQWVHQGIGPAAAQRPKLGAVMGYTLICYVAVAWHLLGLFVLYFKLRVFLVLGWYY